ncbi:STAS domain-containing protein [Gallaecimonas xiamenensis]|uniref:MlaB-like STAS domain-containing protein n=1 Tax=Gallaecimonas xiamenensis 3-C-1 TaxID=745411 RepID=K2J888_9GAMM|nr:STAS domain-containing protein [Gallaecimonas xiamenensis]EKE71052.1 hypothetical protein B3C1_12884 [Gallaecimonas xiamenensis 3-C-1]
MTSLTLPERLTVAQVQPLWADWQALTEAVIDIDGAAVTQVDVAGLQLLLCLAQDRTLTWTACSQPLYQSLVLAGLDDAFSLPAI